MKHTYYFLAFLLLGQIVFAQSSLFVKTDSLELFQLQNIFLEKYTEQKLLAEQKALQLNIPLRKVSENISTTEVQLLMNGLPIFYSTDNLNSCKTTSSNRVWTGGGAGLNLSGTGIQLRVWDAGSAFLTHQEVSGRATLGAGQTSEINYHSAHVAGTMIATGVDAAAKGHAYLSTIKSFDWTNDLTEMSTDAASGMLISNHSYGISGGWEGTTWYGDPTVSSVEDWKFGFYDEVARDFDLIANAAPYYLCVVSAGNDRDDTGPVFGGSYTIYATGATAIANGTEPNDDGEYDCLDPGMKTAKNSLVVGSCFDITAGYSIPEDIGLNTFSSYGPTDDGRIKPDILANGNNLKSCGSTTTNSYSFLSGTSMAAPSVSGACGLLQQHYFNVFGSYMLASTLKGVIIHTADQPNILHGPSYSFGWGLMNTEEAALQISDAIINPIRMHELDLNESEIISIPVSTDGLSPIKITIVWNDPAGNIPTVSVDPVDTILVNDLDLRLIKNTDASIFYPYTLDKNNPTNAALQQDNKIDNVEFVYVQSPIAGNYTITISHKDLLVGAVQTFSLLISGLSCADDSSVVNVAIDEGENYLLPDGNLVSIAGSYPVAIPNSFGCDDVITTNLTVNPVCEIVTGVFVNAITASAVKVNWSAADFAVKYQVWYRQVGTTIWSKKTATGLFKKITGLLASTTYEYKIKTVCATLSSGFSPVQNFTTAPLKENEIEEDESFDVEIFPNPNDGNFEVVIDQLKSKSCSIQLFDLNGKLVYENIREGKYIHAQINLTNEPAQFYLLKIINESEIKTIPIIVVK